MKKPLKNRRPKQGDRKETRRQPEKAPERGSGPGLIYGALPVLEALRARPERIHRVMIAEGTRPGRMAEVLELARERSVLVDRISRQAMERLVGPDSNDQGIAASVAAADYVSTDEILQQAGDPPLLVILDGVEDPRNLGAVLRTAECAGADGVLIPERRAAGLTDTVAKASAGAIEHILVGKAANLNRLIEELKARGIWVIGTSGDAEMSYADWDWTLPAALVLGSEGHGLHRLVAGNCDTLVKIPMYGKISSLNISVAAGVVLFEARRQRDQKTGKKS
jgi:23S rRNA (guanosine2251-2'-O)-methyltransferase